MVVSFHQVLIALHGQLFAAIQAFRAHELAVVQHPPPVHPLLVVPVDHHSLVLQVQVVIRLVLVNKVFVSQRLSLQLRIFLVQFFLVHIGGEEKVPAVLDLVHSRLPVQVQHVHLRNGNVTQAAGFAAVPEHTIGTCAFPQLLILHRAVGLFEVVHLHGYRYNAAQLLGLRLIVLHPGQDVRFGIAVHGVRVLADDAVPQPRCRLRDLRQAPAFHHPLDHVPVI